MKTIEKTTAAEGSSYPEIRYVIDSRGRRVDHASAERFADALIRLAESRNGDGEGEEEPPPGEPLVRRGSGGFLPCFKCGERGEIRRGFVCCSECRRPPPRQCYHPAHGYGLDRVEKVGEDVCSLCKGGGWLPDRTFECGDAWNIERFVTLEPHPVHATIFALSRLVAKPPRWSCDACRGTGKIKDCHHRLSVKRNVGAEAEGAPRELYASADDLDPVKLAEWDFLAIGGWSVWELGSTGTPRGRPSAGIRTEDELIAAINLGLQDPERRARIDAIFEKPGRSGARALREELIGGVAPADRNTEAIATFFRITPRAARNLVRSPISPKEGRVFEPPSVNNENESESEPEDETPRSCRHAA
jgi:hypothetical protein